MRYFHFVVFFFLFALLGCSDSSREEYAIPNIKEISEQKQVEVILEHLSEHIKSNPSNPSNYYKRASLQYKIGNYDEALIDVSRAERLSPNSGEILYLKSAILYKSGKDNALENALFAEGQDYETPELFTLIGNLYLNKKEFSNAAKYFKRAENIYPYDPDIFNGRGRYFAMQRDTFTAINNFKRAINLKSTEFKYFDDLIKLYGEARLIDSALNLNEEAIRKFPKKTELVFNKARILQNAGLADSSIRIYRHFLKLEPERFDVYEKIGDIYFRKKNYSSAFVTYNKWADLEPKKSEPLLKAARSYIAQDNLPAAKYYLNKALDKIPDDTGLRAELNAVNYRIEQAAMGHYRPYESRTKDPKAEKAEEDSRIFDRSIEINQLPKRRPTGIGRDTTRN